MTFSRGQSLRSPLLHHHYQSQSNAFHRKPTRRFNFKNQNITEMYEACDKTSMSIALHKNSSLDTEDLVSEVGVNAPLMNAQSDLGQRV